MQHFSKRFHQKANAQLLQFHSSISFDKRLAKEDILGSLAHVKALFHAKILSAEEAEGIQRNLEEILGDMEHQNFLFSEEFEDIHMNIEHELIQRMGDVGKKLHTGRSRNDQIALDMKLFVRSELQNVTVLLQNLVKSLLALAEQHLETYMPAFTHLQKAQATTFAHYLMAYVEMFFRDIQKIKNTLELLNYCPLGSAALTGTTYPIDRNLTSSLLNFKAPTNNSLDSVSDRDYLLDAMHNFSLIMMHLSRFCEELILFSSQDYGYIEISDDFSTGSSIMPQKKNPDAAELIRGKTGRVFGHLFALFTTMKSLPLAYNKDLQEDKEAFFDSLDNTKACLSIFTAMVSKIQINKARMREACYQGYIEATDIADYLTAKGLPFRDAYAMVGAMVKDAHEENSVFQNWSLAKFQEYSPLFQKDIFQVISLESMISHRITLGSPKKENVILHIQKIKREL
ncbi:MAG TPA: argininosuccinate lyase [Fusobacterium sp.]|uniref:argininosuccinate lyase n=1 Tax=Fusobacterium sp. TaxID=68766 RepID=UPI002F41E373